MRVEYCASGTACSSGAVASVVFPSRSNVEAAHDKHKEKEKNVV